MPTETISRHRGKNLPVTPWKRPALTPEDLKAKRQQVKARSQRRRQASLSLREVLRTRKPSLASGSGLPALQPEKPTPKAQVSQFTRDRLYSQALTHPAYEGMAPEDVRRYINQKLDQYIEDYPVWFGHLKADHKRELTDAQREHLRRMLERKKEIRAEIEKPYVKGSDPEPVKEEEVRP